MPSFAIAQLRDVTMGPPIVTYLEAIDATLAPFGGRFLVHGGALTRAEGAWPAGDLIVIAADPDRQGRGGATAPIDHAVSQMRLAGMEIVMVETGDDPGHTASRATCEHAGFERWPVTPYVRRL